MISELEMQDLAQIATLIARAAEDGLRLHFTVS
jgi:hypothetical protein